MNIVIKAYYFITF